ncbi:MAG: ornithine carbamoyltransferase [Hyphomicrobiales bacterium]|jgi:ornithine carbamoyltransferase|nr:ornithine carbamoyltransferase [Hyphomicrobiales bacterium]|tara:strand:+ start:134 stop:1063 length:930 start_codon:yes stop_codon:yes gene_type:complete
MQQKKINTIKNFINLNEIDRDELYNILTFGLAAKNDKTGYSNLLKNKSLILLFDEPSTRTRISFELAINQLGGHCIFLDSSTSQLGRGESIKDTAKVLSRYVDGVIIRNASHKDLNEFANNSDCSVINALTNLSHPCQIMADLMTLHEHMGSIENINIAWVGDGNNVANTWIQASQIFGFNLNMAVPSQFSPNKNYLKLALDNKAKINITENINDVVSNADCIVTDTWVSMNDKETNKEEKIKILEQYQVNEKLFEKTPKHAVFLHCLPAHRGQEVTNEVIDSPRSLVYQQAENRLHIQKGILKYCFGI